MGLLDLFKTDKKPEPPIENIGIQRLAPKCKSWKVDTLLISTSRNCTQCKQYNKKVYSLYGWNKSYPKIPTYLFQQKCPTCGCSIGVSLYQPGINTPIK